MTAGKASPTASALLAAQPPLGWMVLFSLGVDRLKFVEPSGRAASERRSKRHEDPLH